MKSNFAGICVIGDEPESNKKKINVGKATGIGKNKNVSGTIRIIW